MTETVTPAASRRAWIRALTEIGRMDADPRLTLAAMLDALATEHGPRPALVGPAETLSYTQLADRARRVALWALAEGVGANGAVGLMMPNRPDYVTLWMGLTRVGRTVALINTNLSGEALAHCLRAAEVSDLIVDAPLRAAAERAVPRACRLWHYDSPAALGLDLYENTPLDEATCPFPAPRDVALLIYTSGTTGLPKAARVTHGRILEWSLWFAGMMDSGPDDRLYDCLPMYHSTGGIVAIGAMLVRGGSVLIAPRFSASRFWDEVVEGGCTIFQYIGELCRYLTAAPPHPNERAHRLRLACGNGLRGDVWETFQDRFGIPRILEFYAATEGNVSLYNCEGRPGAIGRVPPFLAARFPIALIRCDPVTGAPERDAEGRGIRCGPDEVGEAIGRLDAAADAPARRFDGYTDPEASERKVFRDVFAPGDRWFRTGDLMRKDATGFYYFVDRVGDTFRWKGENVSTTEVAAALLSCPGVTDAIVYGVTVPDHDGRAGMAALATDPAFDFVTFHAHVQERLPDYARPLFVRLCPTLEVTGTFKLTATALARDGWDEAADPVWFLDRTAGRYVPCDATLRHVIGTGQRRL
jgi:fatty-acyl-CoA synthase